VSEGCEQESDIGCEGGKRNRISTRFDESVSVVSVSVRFLRFSFVANLL
jgi:hypothetical protein